MGRPRQHRRRLGATPSTASFRRGLLEGPGLSVVCRVPCVMCRVPCVVRDSGYESLGSRCMRASGETARGIVFQVKYTMHVAYICKN